MNQQGLNFRTMQSQEAYGKAYATSLSNITIPIEERYVSTSFGYTHVLCCGEEANPPLVLLHAASCGSPIWYKNLPTWSKQYRIYAVDLIGEASKSILTKKMKTTSDNALWLNETMNALHLETFFLCGLSIGGWNVANYASYYPKKVMKLVLLSPVQTFAKMYRSYFFKIIKMGFSPTRKHVEEYIGWGNELEAPLPDSIIEQFTLSVMNMNGNASFPRWIKQERLEKLNMPVLVLLGEHEFAFSIKKAEKRAHQTIATLTCMIIKDASHLLPVSKPDEINQSVIAFLTKQS